MCVAAGILTVEGVEDLDMLAYKFVRGPASDSREVGVCGLGC